MTEMELTNNLSKNMRFLRLKKEPLLSQEMLAKKLGITQASLSKYESGSLLPPVHILHQIACYYGYTMDELLSANLPKK